MLYEVITLIDLPKAEIVRSAIALGVDPAMTVSCYQADLEGRACGRCDACRIRRAGFEAAGVPDTTRYRITSYNVCYTKLLRKMRRASLVFRQRIERGTELLVEGEVTIALVDRVRLKPARMPQELKNALNAS